MRLRPPVVVGSALALVLPAAAVSLARVVNSRRTDASSGAREFDPRDLDGYDLARPGLDITLIQRGDVVGFHVVPDELSRSGVIVTFGGSEGSPDLETAVGLARGGHEVFAMFFYGQPGQEPELVAVPLERWRRIRDVVEAEAADPSVVTVVASSKGAEFALSAASQYDDIDHLVLYAPSAYRYPGLARQRAETERSSWTQDGHGLPCIPFSTKNIRALSWLTPFVARQVVGLPVQYGIVYQGALRCASPDVRAAARIEVERYAGDLVLFAGTDDRMWPSADFAETIRAHRPERTDAHQFPGAGHAFGGPAAWAGVSLGGTPEANEDAAACRDQILRERLAAWHPQC